jgi:predicted alpha-1,2-mannosidase
MPTYFHGDHASVFITGSYLRGLRGFDVEGAYRLMLRNATVESKNARPYLAEYVAKGYISELAVEKPRVETQAKAGVTKTLEYAYNDYAVALLARELNDEGTHAFMMRRASNFTNVFDPSTGLMRGRLANGDWVKPFDPQQPYYEYMYREANAWQSSFFAPHDTEGLIALYPSKEAFERKLDRLFSIPWNPKHIAMNINSFIGQYCHGNQPDHGFPYLYYWVGKPEKSQAIINEIMDRFYGMDSGLTLCGMDDAGEMSAWYVFNAIGLYPYSPADPEYLITVPLFDEVKLQLNDKTLTIEKPLAGLKISEITYDGQRRDGYSITHRELLAGSTMVVKVADETKPQIATPLSAAVDNAQLKRNERGN